MSQLKEQFAVALRYGFWIGVAFCLLLSLGVWFMATSQLQSVADSQKQKIESNFTSVSSLQSKLSSHPNPTSHVEMERLIEERKKDVLEAWTNMYERQRHLLTWPKELKEDFVKEFEDLIPIEQYVNFPPDPGQEKESFLLNRYNYYIGLVLPDIAKYARAKWTAPVDMNAGGAGGEYSMAPAVTRAAIRPTARQEKEEEPLVEWSAGSQGQLLADLFPWRQGGREPSTLEVYYSQENLWILKQLLQIIDNVNGDAKHSFEAKIRAIKTLKIGRSVPPSAGRIKSVASATAGMMGEYGMEMDGMDMEDYGSMGVGGDLYGDEEMGGGMGGGYGEAVALDPADNRYIDTDYQPVTGAALRSALVSDSPTDVNIAVAKRVPVMMSLTMDQRSIPQLLAACGNAKLMVEVRQVRILPKGASSVAVGGGGGGGGGFGMMGGDGGYGDVDSYDGGDEMDGGYGDEMDGGYGVGGGLGRAQTPAENPYDMDVEVYGLISIYNPPNESKLGLDQVTEETVVEGITDAVKPKPAADDSASPAPAAEVPPADPVTADPAAPAAADPATVTNGSPVAEPTEPVQPEPVQPEPTPVDPVNGQAPPVAPGTP